MVWLTRHPRCAGTSDLAGQIVGALVSTALVFREKEPMYFNKLMTEARDLYSAAVARKKAYSSPFIYDCAPPVRPTKPFDASPLCVPELQRPRDRPALQSLFLHARVHAAGAAQFDSGICPCESTYVNQDKP